MTLKHADNKKHIKNDIKNADLKNDTLTLTNAEVKEPVEKMALKSADGENHWKNCH